MTDKYLTIDNLFTIEDTSELKAPSFDDEKSPTFKNSPVAISQTLRIEEDVPASWSGVRGCCSSERVGSEITIVRDNWVARKLLEYRDLQWLRYGIVSVSGTCSSGTRWDGARWCRTNSDVRIRCFIEFREP